MRSEGYEVVREGSVQSNHSELTSKTSTGSRPVCLCVCVCVGGWVCVQAADLRLMQLSDKLDILTDLVSWWLQN